MQDPTRATNDGVRIDCQKPAHQRAGLFEYCAGVHAVGADIEEAAEEIDSVAQFDCIAATSMVCGDPHQGKVRELAVKLDEDHIHERAALAEKFIRRTSPRTRCPRWGRAAIGGSRHPEQHGAAARTRGGRTASDPIRG